MLGRHSEDRSDPNTRSARVAVMAYRNLTNLAALLVKSQTELVGNFIEISPPQLSNCSDAGGRVNQNAYHGEVTAANCVRRSDALQ